MNDSLQTIIAQELSRGRRLSIEECFVDTSRGVRSWKLVIESRESGAMAPTGFVIVRCTGPYSFPEGRSVADLPASITGCAIVSVHPLLIPLQEQQVELFIAGRPLDADHLLARMTDAIEHLLKGFYAPSNLLGPAATLRSKLEGGFGLFATLPASLAQAVAECLQEAGCRPSLIPSELRKPDCRPLQVLVLEPSVASLIMWEARVQRTRDAGRVHDLIRKARGW